VFGFKPPQGAPRVSGNGRHLVWGLSDDGLPVEADAPDPMLRQEEAANLPVRADFHSRLFRLWIPEEKEQFDRVCNLACNGAWEIITRTDRWPEDKDAPEVWLEWVELFHVTPRTESHVADTATDSAPSGK